jgi:hypothetical protein
LRTFPEIAKHLVSNTIFPETYCQKWFVGLCLHVMPFENLFEFLEKFFFHGAIFLYRFALSLMEHISVPLLETNDPVKIFALLRLDPKVIEPDFAAIIKGADAFELDTGKLSLHTNFFRC